MRVINRKALFGVLLMTLGSFPGGCAHSGKVVPVKPEDPPVMAMDQHSACRWKKLQKSNLVLVSLHGMTAMEALELGPDERRLGGLGPEALVEVLPESLPEIVTATSPARVVVWGAGSVLDRLDPLLRQEMLSSLSAPQETLFPVLATFEMGAHDLRETLTVAGAAVRSVTKAVVTLDADFETLTRILARDDLIRLGGASLQQPLQH